MVNDAVPVCKCPDIDGLLRVVRQLDKWKGRMENLAARDVPDAIITRIFYGEPMPEDVPPEQMADYIRKQVIASRAPTAAAEPAPSLIPDTPCSRCHGAGWCWCDELDDRAGHDPHTLVVDDTKYSCPDCGGSGKMN